MSEIFGRLVLYGRADAPDGGYDWERKWLTPMVATGRRERIQAEFGTHYISGNDHPTWSVTSTTYEVDRKGRRVDVGGGAAHEEILRHWPALAPIVQFHLHDARSGMPMHARDNGAYYAQLALGIGLYMKPKDLTPEGREGWFHAFCRHVVGGLTEHDPEDIGAIFKTPIEVKPPEGVIFEGYAESVNGRKARRFEVQARVFRFITEREPVFALRNEELLAQFRMQNEPPSKAELDAQREYDVFGNSKA